MGTLRIIGGKFRGRKIHFPDESSIRPTPDRVRETLFNWLAPYINGARCLDLFAGSGALGFEAVSRGALYVEMVDNAYSVIQHLKKNCIAMNINNVHIVKKNVPYQLKPPIKPFDIVFLDPPFRQDIIKPCCEWLEQNNGLHANSHIYIESEKELDPLPIPPGWNIIKEKIAGQIKYSLVVCH